MGQYSKAIITAAGQSLIAIAIAGEAQLNITKAKTSDYKYPDGTDYKVLTDMEGVKQVLDSPETKVLSNDLIQTRMLFSNEEIKATYYIQNIGLYAMDGIKEVLFCIVTAAVPDEMPQYNGVAATSYIYNIQNVVQDAETIHITVSSAGNATIQDVMERVDATGGDISETVIETLEPIDTKYPVPSAGESTKVFLGKVTKYIEDTKPLDADMTVYVANTGNDTTGTGFSTAPYKTITYALNKIPKNLNGYTGTVNIAAGVYIEDVMISGFSEELQLVLAGNVLINNIVVQECNVICNNGNSGTTRTLTTQFMQVEKNGSLSVLTGVNINVGGYIQDQPYAGRRSSILVINSKLAIYSAVNIAGNSDIAVAVHTNAQCHINNIIGTGLSLGTYIGAGSTVSYVKNNLSASALQWTDAGTVVSPYGAVIGTLRGDLTLYVATTGSDSTGDGTSAKPFKTIQYTINSLPKDLNGHIASIYIESGTYNEDISVSGFGNAGRLMLVPTGNITIGGIKILGSYLVMTSSDTAMQRAVTTKYLLVVDGAIFNAWSSINITTNGFIFDSITAPNNSSIIVSRNSSAYLSGQTTLTNNTDAAIIVANISNVYFYSLVGSGFTIGVAVYTASRATIANSVLTATVPTVTGTGGRLINDSGSQISNMITSGLSCSWGTLSGGYIRNGNANGRALITIQIHATITSALSAGSTYSIYGFPPSSYTNLCVTVSPQVYVSNCWVSSTGVINLVPQMNFSTGQSISFNCTYLTNS